MNFYILVLLSALGISITGAYFSILGLATMFPGASIAVITMGSVLEIGKIVAAVWLHRNWHTANKLMKGYLTAAVVILMLITSMGIFGFLSKAHIEHSYLTEKEMAAVEQIDEKILREKQFITRQESYITEEEKRLTSSKDINLIDIQREEKRIEQINSQLNKDVEFEQDRIDQLADRRRELDTSAATLEAESGGLFSNKKQKLQDLKELQAEERASIQASIKRGEEKINTHRQKADTETKESRTKIADFQQARGGGHSEAKEEIEKYNKLINEATDRINEFEVSKIAFDEKVRTLEAEVGPVKYIAKLFEDLGGSEIKFDKAVRLVIIVLIFVFDPLAILLILAAVHGLNETKDGVTKAPTPTNEGLDDVKKKVTSLEAQLQDVADSTDIEEALDRIQTLKSQLPDREEVKDIINFYKKQEDKKKITFDESYRQNLKLDGFLHKAKSQLRKTRSLIKNNRRRILTNGRMARQNKTDGESTFKKIVSSIKTKIEKF
jgi:hypothetical protein